MLKFFTQKGRLCLLCKVMFILFVVSILMSLTTFMAQASNFSSLQKLSKTDYQWIGERIFQNEAASKTKYLTHWGRGEDFPSFGIAHFIWFPQGVDAPFQQTFPAMYRYVSQQTPAPAWLQALAEEAGSSKSFYAPWQIKSGFDAEQQSPKLESLRRWLLSSKQAQAEFVVLSFQQRWQTAMQSYSDDERQRLTLRLKQLMSFKQGLFAVVDYFNFKGLGLKGKEQYQGEYWGLISVFEQMEATLPVNSQAKRITEEMLLNHFIEAAKQRLKLRTELAPEGRNEQRWLPGWYRRLEGYRTL